MRKHRFFIPEHLVTDQLVSLPKDIRHQVQRVLRLRSGDTIYIFNNTGYEYTAILDNDYAKIVAQTADTTSSNLKIHLAQVIGKGTKMNLVIQKATELGVDSITPLFSKYSISKDTNKLENWQNVAIAACCQCWRNTVPTIHQPIELQDWLTQGLTGTNVLFMPGGQNLKDIKIATNANILIGPEGGFNQTEVDAATQQGFIAGNLGPRILRTETAGIAAIAILQAIAGDM